MRIMHVLNHTVLCNGHVHATVDLACMQSKLGHSVWLCSGGGNFNDVLARWGVEHIKINQERRPINLIKAVAQLRKAVIAHRPDIVHAHMMTSAGLVWLLRRFMQFGFVTTVHNSFQRSSIIMGLADRVIAVSDAVRLIMARRGVSVSKMRTVLNGTIGSPRMAASIPSPQNLNRPAISYVGGLHGRKGVDDLITAFKLVSARIPRVHLYIVGGGGMGIPYYEKLARDIGCDTRVNFCGPVADPRPFLLGSDIFVLASHAEPAGLVISEAREAGCAIVATAVDGTPEMLENGQAGMLVPPKRPDLLAEALISVLSDGALLTDLRRRSQINITKLSVGRVAQETIEVYGELGAASPCVRVPPCGG